VFAVLKSAVLAPAPPTPSSYKRVGPKFIQSLFNRLAKMLDQPIACNLLVTGLVTRLALYPLPILRAFLLDRQFVRGFAIDSPSLFDVLDELARAAMIVEKEDGFHALLASNIKTTERAEIKFDAGSAHLPSTALSGTPLLDNVVSSSLWDGGDFAVPRAVDRGRSSSPTMSEVRDGERLKRIDLMKL
jgi:hypothetical protein